MTVPYPPKLLAARELALLAQEVAADLEWLAFALSILHGTFHDKTAPRGYTPDFRVAVPVLRHTVGLEVDREAMMDEAMRSITDLFTLARPSTVPPRDQLN